MEDNSNRDKDIPENRPQLSEGDRIEALQGVLSRASSAPALTDLQLSWNAECLSLHEAVRVFWSAPPLQALLKELLTATELSEAMIALLVAAHEDLANGQCGAFLPIVCPNLVNIDEVVANPQRLLDLFLSYGTQRTLNSAQVLKEEYNETVKLIPGIDETLKDPLLKLLSTAKQLSELTLLGNLALIFSSELDSFLPDQ